MKNIITFCGIWRFSGQKRTPNPMKEGSKVRLASLFGSPSIRSNLSRRNFSRSCWQIGVIPALVSFLWFPDQFFLTLGPFLGATPLNGKKTIEYPDATFYSESSEKYFCKNFHPEKSPPDLENRWRALSGC